MAEARGASDVESVLSYFASELRRYRELSGLTQEQLGDGFGYTGGMVSMIETGRRLPTRKFIQYCDRTLTADGALVKLWPLINRESLPSWFRPLVELEKEARVIHEFEPLAIPGLLQTTEYARATLASARPLDSTEEIERLVTARIDRQHIFSKPRPPLLMITIDEGVLHRQVGGAEVMRAQLDFLLEMSRRPRVYLQVLPFGVQEHPGLLASFKIMSFQEGSDVLYLETAASGHLVEETDEVERHALAYDVLQSKSLSQEASRDLIRQLRGDIDYGPHTGPVEKEQLQHRERRQLR